MASFDQRILDAVVDHRTDAVVSVFKVITQLGSFWFLWIVGIATSLGWKARFGDWFAARFLAIVAATAWVSSHLIKWIVDRDRPPLDLRLTTATGSAFPSGHATQSAAVYGALAVLWAIHHPDRRARRAAYVVAALIALAVGFSRVYLGVHWATDVLAGWTLGTIVVVALARRLRPGLTSIA